MTNIPCIITRDYRVSLFTRDEYSKHTKEYFLSTEKIDFLRGFLENDRYNIHLYGSSEYTNFTNNRNKYLKFHQVNVYFINKILTSFKNKSTVKQFAFIIKIENVLNIKFAGQTKFKLVEKRDSFSDESLRDESFSMKQEALGFSLV